MDWNGDLWKQEHAKMLLELEKLADQRRRIAAEQLQVDERIVLLTKAVASLEDLMGLDSTKARAQSNATREYILGPKIADKIRFVLSRWPGKALTARNIMTLLAELGFKFDVDSRPLATIHAVCHRLVNAKQPLVEATSKDGTKAWRWLG